MAFTPTRLKAVSFRIPSSASASLSTSTQQPATASRSNERVLSPKPSSLLNIQGKSQALNGSRQSPLSSQQNNDATKSAPTAQHGAQPDLVADIVESKPSSSQDGARLLDSQQKQSGAVSRLTPSHQGSPTTGKRHGSRVYVRGNARSFASTALARERSPLLDQHKHKSSKMTTAQAAQIAGQVRCTTNSSCHEHIRALKYDVARLREQLLKTEEEIKNMNRGRTTLELAIQDVRKALSVNQQSISTQQKKSSKGDEDSSVKLLRGETTVLSRSKRKLEQHLQSIKQHLQGLDAIRRSLKSKISSLSRSLELDAQNLKVYDGPSSTRLDSRQRHYATGYPEPKSGARDEAIDQFCSRATDAVANSRSVRGEIKPLVVSVQASKAETHGKICTAISNSVEEAKAQKREMILERGQIRMAQNSANHQKHNEEIALGVALGPVSDKHRSVSEKSERPLSRTRPASAAEERINFNKTTTKLTRQLSATVVRATKVNDFDRQLSRQLRQGSQMANYDTHTLRVRKMSLDNRWVQ